MAKMLTLDELLMAALRSDMPGAEAMALSVERLASDLAARLADHLGVEAGLAQVHDDGLDDQPIIMVGLAPLNEGDPVPEVLQAFDSEADWEPRRRPDAAERAQQAGGG